MIRLHTLVALPIAFTLACSITPQSVAPTEGDTADATGTTEGALVASDEQSSESEEQMDEAVELGLSGASDDTTAEAGPDDASGVADVDAKLGARPGRFFRTPGCVTSTRLGPGEWKHVLNGCVGPYGRVTYTGTVTSKWTADNGILTVVHTAEGFEAKGPNVTSVATGSRTVTYAKSSGVVTRTRKGSWSGTLTVASGKSLPWTHEASFTSTFDRTTRCITRDGTAANTVGDVSFGRTMTAYERCGVAAFACPESGKLSLSRKDGALTIEVTYEGGGKAKIERNGKTVGHVKLAFCRAS